MYHNSEKEKRLPKILAKSLDSAEESALRYEREFYRLVDQRREKLNALLKKVTKKLEEVYLIAYFCLEIRNLLHSIITD